MFYGECAMFKTRSFSLLRTFASFIVIFLFTASGCAFGQILRVLNSFNGTNGAEPFGTLVSDAAGNFYGATISGGSGNQGVVFKLTRSGGGWVETVLHNFTGGDDGGGPQTPLAVDAAGNVYGAATYGGVGANLGVVFEISPSASGWTETVLHSFIPGDPLAAPYAGVALDRAGNIYGTTTLAGGGYGGVYELSPTTGGGWHYSPIHVFQSHGHDGAIPYSPVTVGPHGVLYGVTEQGGTAGVGTVFSLTPSSTGWRESVLYSFQSGTDGSSPFGGVTVGPSGQLYGTTLLGGANGEGTLFGLTLDSGKWSEQILYSFGSFTGDALTPAGPLAINASGNLFGATSFGGANGKGTIFELTQNGGSWQDNIIYSFATTNDGLNGVTAVTLDRADNIYGVGPGGAKREGMVYEIVP
jgi:uncharacterized repeat protein (TIGR03803 family)